VKNVISILGIIVVATLGYLSSICGTDTYSLHAANTGKPDTAQEIYAPAFVTNLFCHTSPSESSVKSFNNAAPSSKNPCSGFWGILKLAERLFESKYAQYTSISNDFLIKFRKADIIFPFHYFW
jgi:hypothetical protein